MFDPNQIYVSPSIKYSGHEYMQNPLIIGMTKKVQCAFRLRIRSGSYGIGQETVGASEVMDENFNNELE